MEFLNRLKNLIKKFVPHLLINWYHFLLAFLGGIIYCFPSRKLKIIGVTGTNGKSTVVEMISRVLEKAGFSVASLSSIRFKIKDKEQENILKMTMPGRLKLQRFLREAASTGCQYAVLEVTSEGIKQHRHRFINFDVAVFTNLSPEHIEAHGSFEKYREAKGKLFQATRNIHILNLDDENAKYFSRFPAKEKYAYTISGKKLTANNNKGLSLIYCPSFSLDQNGVNFEVQNTRFNLKLLGKFNIYNALAAICVGLSQGLNLETCKRALEGIEGIPGRMEKVISEPFKVFVDYAFTPNALEKVYQTIQKTKNNKEETKMICVLGAAGGGRDKWKRPVLGKIAARHCDDIIVTNEDPYDEDPMEIINQVTKGTGAGVKKILDRREAIRESLKGVRPGDVVIITGKGCEPWICTKGGEKIPWDDRRVVREELEKLRVQGSK